MPRHEQAHLSFVNGLVQNGRKGPPKLYHKKSRNGCQRCRQRRVKCNEVHPVCGNCSRHDLPCVYNGHRSSIPSQSTVLNSIESPSVALTTKPTVVQAATTKPSEIPESKDRRHLELLLFHYYTSQTSHTLLGSADQVVNEAWTKVVPNLALSSDALLYAVCSLSALHLLHECPEAADVVRAQPLYLNMALREHQKDVLRLDKNNADTVCLLSCILRLHAFIMLQNRPLEPWNPPLEWLHMSHSAGNVLREAWNFIEQDETCALFRMIKRMPVFWDEEEKYGEANRVNLMHLLERQDEDVATEPWSPQIQQAYEHTTSYLGSIHRATAAQEEFGDICRRLVGFPVFVPRQFIDLVEARQPRAMIILAHYFGLISTYSDIWWIGNAGYREVQAIKAVLTTRWQI